MHRTFLAAIVAAPTLLACTHRSQAVTNLVPERVSQTAGSRADAPREGTSERRAYLTALEGIVLTAKQWNRIEQIREKYRIRVLSLGLPSTPEDQELAVQLMRSQLDEVRAVLTPEQRPAFDRNCALMRNRGPRRGPARADR